MPISPDAVWTTESARSAARLPAHGHRSARHRECRPHHRRPARRARPPRDVGTRDPAGTADREEYAAWAAGEPGVTLATFEEAAAGAELAFLVTSGDAALDVLDLAGAGNLDGKVVVDVSNPLDFSAGLPADAVGQGHRLAGGAAAARPPGGPRGEGAQHDERLGHGPPRQPSEPTTAFVAGDDEEAKAVVTGLLEDFGHTDVIDLGDISMARGTEMFLPLWVRLMGSLGTASFNIKVVR